jgi:hypothetical protein
MRNFEMNHLRETAKETCAIRTLIGESAGWDAGRTFEWLSEGGLSRAKTAFERLVDLRPRVVRLPEIAKSFRFGIFLRKEVIQPQVPLRLPCYDFTPVTNPTFNGGPLAVSLAVFWLSQLPWCDGRCVQGPGTYSPRRSDPRLLAIPTSWSRVADSNPN